MVTDPTPDGADWKALRANINFRVERFLAQGAYSKVVALWIVLLLVSIVGGVLAWLTPAISFGSLNEAVWWAFLRLSDPGYLGEADSRSVRLISIVLTILGLALFVGLLIAIITQAFTERMERLALGLTPVRFKGHVAVLGWTNRTLEIVAELLASRKDPPRVVVLVECITAEIEQALRDRLPKRLYRRVMLRTGDPERVEDLARIGGHSAEAVVLSGADKPDREAGTGDPLVLKVIASIDKTTDEQDRRPRIVAEIGDPELIPVAHSAYPGTLQMIASDVLVGRSLALGVQAPGLSPVLADLVDVRSGCTLRVERLSSLAGETITGASGRTPRAVILGALRGGEGDQRVDARPDIRLEEQDNLLILAPVGEVIETLVASPWGVEPRFQPREEPDETESTHRLLVLGWSGKVRSLCRELAGRPGHHLEIDLVSRQDSASRESLIPDSLPGLTVRHVVGNAASPNLFSTLDPSAYDRIVLIGSENASDRYEADSRTITSILLLLARLQGAAVRPHIIAEVLDPANRAVLEDRGVELVVTPELVARALVGGVMHPDLAGIFGQMVQGGLGQFGAISLQGLVRSEATTFGEIESYLRSQGIVSLGLQREACAFAPEIVPDKRESLRIGPRDRALVVRPRAAQ